MKVWDKIPLSTICTPAERFTTPTAGEIYRQLGVRLWGAGTYEREKIDGADTKYLKFNRVDVDDLVVNKIWARNGAVGVANSEQADTFVSTEFPIFILDKNVIQPEWMRLVTKWPGFWHSCDEKARGTSGKNRIKPNQFLTIKIPLPPMEEQRALVGLITSISEKSNQLEKHLEAAERDADHLLAVHFKDVIANAPIRKMVEVAPLIRREQPIDLNGSYPELGIRSFGKGTFHKPPLSGADVGTKRLYRIEPGDLVFSNVFAWEGAIAIAQPEDLGRFGSHRFITCDVNTKLTTAVFLHYYFLSDEGMMKIREASPGGAGRNRTLGLEKLMAIDVPVPSITLQESFIRLQSEVAALKVRHNQIRKANSALIPAMLDRLFAQQTGEQNALNQ